MLRFPLLFFLAIILNVPTNSYAQVADRFALINDYVSGLSVGQQSLESFTQETLIRESQTELEKAWAVYVWITRNIAYDCKTFHSNTTTKIKYTSEEDLAMKVAKMEEKELRRTIRLKKGVCEDYAQLFQAMCNYLGIESEIITGYGRTSYQDIGRAHRAANHAWNRFKVDNNWYLVDATWGAGFTDVGVTRFTREFRPAYFNMSPEDMITHHFPDKEAWQQLALPLSKEEAAEQAIFHYGYWRYRVEGLTPSNGLIEGRNIRFEITMDEPVDPGQLAVVQDNLIVHQGFTKNGNTYSAEVTFKKRSRRRIMVGVRKGKQKFDTIVEYKLK